MNEITHRCGQCNVLATVYAMGRKPGDWAGFYCESCARLLDLQVTDRFGMTERDLNEWWGV